MPAVSGHLCAALGSQWVRKGSRPQVWSVEREAEINEPAETVSLTDKAEDMREDGPRAPTEPVARVGSVGRVWLRRSRCGCGDGLKGGWCGRGQDGPSPRAPVYGPPGRVAAEGGAPGADCQRRLGTQASLPPWLGRAHGTCSVRKAASVAVSSSILLTLLFSYYLMCSEREVYSSETSS